MKKKEMYKTLVEKKWNPEYWSESYQYFARFSIELISYEYYPIEFQQKIFKPSNFIVRAAIDCVLKS